jgi:hypothetical protein
MNANELRAWHHGLLQSSLDVPPNALARIVVVTSTSIVANKTSGSSSSMMFRIVIGRINPSTFYAIRQDDILSANAGGARTRKRVNE